MRGVDDEHVDAGLDQRHGALVAVLADADGGAARAAGRPGPWWRCGYCSVLTKSLTVIRPRSWPSPSTSGSFSILCRRSSPSAASAVDADLAR